MGILPNDPQRPVNRLWMLAKGLKRAQDAARAEQERRKELRRRREEARDAQARQNDGNAPKAKN